MDSSDKRNCVCCGRGCVTESAGGICAREGTTLSAIFNCRLHFSVKQRNMCERRSGRVLGYVGLSLLGRVVSATWVYHRGLCYVPAIPTTAKSPPTPLATRHGGEGRALTGYQATLFTDNGAVSQVTVSNVKSAGKKQHFNLATVS